MAVNLAFGKQLPSFNEGFGSLTSQAGPPLLSIRCPTCEAAGRIVIIHQGTTCSHCNIRKCLTPPPDLPYHVGDPQLHAPTPRHANQLPQINQGTDQNPRRSSLQHPHPLHWKSDFDPIPRRSSLPSLVLPNNTYHKSPIKSSPPSMSTLLTPFHPYPTARPTPSSQEYQINSQGEWKPVMQRSEKDTRHCDAEKARRDHQSAYIDLGFSLRRKFMWPEDLDANSQTSTGANSDAATSPGPSLGVTGCSDASCEGKDKPSSRREKLTKQTKLHQQVLWEFRSCLRIDKDRVREWLDDVREQGEELRRKKKDLLERGLEMKGRKAKLLGKETRCSKDEAVLDVWSVMEREFWEFCGNGDDAEARECVGKRRKLSVDDSEL